MSVLSLKNTGVVINRKTTIWAHLPQGHEKAIEVLKSTGHGNLVAENFNSNSLSSLLRELIKANEVPKEFKGVIDKNPKTNLIPKRS